MNIGIKMKVRPDWFSQNTIWVKWTLKDIQKDWILLLTRMLRSNFAIPVTKLYCSSPSRYIFIFWSKIPSYSRVIAAVEVLVDKFSMIVKKFLLGFIDLSNVLKNWQNFSVLTSCSSFGRFFGHLNFMMIVRLCVTVEHRPFLFLCSTF